MPLRKKHKAYIAIGAAVIALIAVGAFLGRTKELKPSETFSAASGSTPSGSTAATGPYGR